MIAHRIAELLKLDGYENETRSYSQMGIAKMLLTESIMEQAWRCHRSIFR